MRRALTALMKTGKYLLLFLGGLVLVFIVSVVLSLLPSNFSKVSEDATIPIFIRSNGLHVDLILPVRSTNHDWDNLLNINNNIQKEHVEYLAFGWGDKGFYFNTPTWSDLSIKTASAALFWPTQSVMHVVGYSNQPSLSASCKQLFVSERQLSGLITFVRNHFVFDQGKAKPYSNFRYGKNDAFFESIGWYNYTYTCNTWTNQALKENGLPSALWTPFDKGVLFHLE